MKRQDLEHILRAAGAIAQTRQLIILGSQAILGSYPDAPAELCTSQKVDTYPADRPENADLIDGTIGELSPFHEQFGYYAHGVGPETAILPRDWRARLIPVSSAATHGVTGLCLHPVDLAVSKLVAGRDKYIQFVAALLRHGLTRLQDIQDRATELDIPDHTQRVIDNLDRCLA